MPIPEESRKQIRDMTKVLVDRLEDDVKDLKGVIACLNKFGDDPGGAQVCILDFLETGKSPAELVS